jgi:hypothetical protein
MYLHDLRGDMYLHDLRDADDAREVEYEEGGGDRF